MYQEMDRQGDYEAPRTEVMGTLRDLTAQVPGNGGIINPNFPSGGGNGGGSGDSGSGGPGGPGGSGDSGDSGDS